jgi:hypothetical protein
MDIDVEAAAVASAVCALPQALSTIISIITIETTIHFFILISFLGYQGILLKICEAEKIPMEANSACLDLPKDIRAMFGFCLELRRI